MSVHLVGARCGGCVRLLHHIFFSSPIDIDDSCCGQFATFHPVENLAEQQKLY